MICTCRRNGLNRLYCIVTEKAGLSWWLEMHIRIVWKDMIGWKGKHIHRKKPVIKKLPVQKKQDQYCTCSVTTVVNVSCIVEHVFLNALYLFPVGILCCQYTYSTSLWFVFFLICLWYKWERYFLLILLKVSIISWFHPLLIAFKYSRNLEWLIWLLNIVLRN